MYKISAQSKKYRKVKAITSIFRNILQFSDLRRIQQSNYPYFIYNYEELFN